MHGLHGDFPLRQVPPAPPADVSASLTQGLLGLLQQQDILKQQLGLSNDPEEQQNLIDSCQPIALQIEYHHNEMLKKLTGPSAAPGPSPPASPERKKQKVDEYDSEEDPFALASGSMDRP